MAKIQVRRDSTVNWTSVNPQLLLGEIGFDTTKKKFKIGDGSTRWNALQYIDDDFVHIAGNETVEGVKTFEKISAQMLSVLDPDGLENECALILAEEDDNGDMILYLLAEDHVEVADLNGNPAEIRGIAAPTTAGSAVNKAYVDGLVGDIEAALGALL